MRRRRRFPNLVPEKNEHRVNDRIRVPRVLVIDEEGKKLGEFLTRDALDLARERGLDLVEVAPNARPPVCRIQDYGRFKYDKKKKDAEARKHQVTVALKEVKLRVKTDAHDLDVKRRHAERFLEDGNKVKVTLRFRGREMAHKDLGEERCREFAALVEDWALVESPPRMDGRQMMMILAPKRRKPTTAASLAIAASRPPLEPMNDEEDDDDFSEDDFDDDSENSDDDDSGDGEADGSDDD